MEGTPLPKEERFEHEVQMPISDTENLHEHASDQKMIKISGFKNISDGDLPTINDYGV